MRHQAGCIRQEVQSPVTERPVPSSESSGACYNRLAPMQAEAPLVTHLNSDPGMGVLSSQSPHLP